MPEPVLLLAGERDHPVGHAQIVADGESVATFADEAVDIRDDRDVEEVVAQVGVGDAVAPATQHELDIGRLAYGPTGSMTSMTRSGPPPSR